MGDTGRVYSACGIHVLRFGPTGLGKSAWGNADNVGNAPGFNGTTVFCPERATQTSIAEPFQRRIKVAGTESGKFIETGFDTLECFLLHCYGTTPIDCDSISRLTTR